MPGLRVVFPYPHPSYNPPVLLSTLPSPLYQATMPDHLRSSSVDTRPESHGHGWGGLFSKVAPLDQALFTSQPLQECPNIW